MFNEKVKNLFNSFRLRKRVLAAVDAFIVVAAALFANWPLPAVAERINRPELLIISVTCVIGCFAGLLFFGAYNKLWRYFSKRDYLSCIKGVVGGMLVAYGLVYLFQRQVFVEFAVLHTLVAIVGVCAFRYMFRGTFVSLVRTGYKEASLANKTRTMIVGAGSAAQMLIKEIRNNQADEEEGLKSSVATHLNPVCLVDDDRYKIGKMFEGVLVAGSTTDIPKIVREERIEQIILAIPSCPPKDRQTILDICGKTGVPVKVLPFIGSLLDTSNVGDGTTSYVNQIRDINVEDLLGRDPIRFDNKDIRDFIEGKVCMVSGGGGSIGSELVRQIAKYNPKQVIIVDIYENNAYDIQQELRMEYGDKLNLVTLIASVRDYFRMNQIFKKYKPQVVFHAAAHKHVPLMENNPMEAIKNKGIIYNVPPSLFL